MVRGFFKILFQRILADGYCYIAGLWGLIVGGERRAEVFV